MRTSSVVAASAALVAGANAWGNVTYTTEVVTAYTTYCPKPTQVVHGAKTYTVTKATTLVITDCPCTVTKPIITKPVVYCPTCPETTPEAETSVPVVYTSSEVVSASVPIVYTTPAVPVGTAPAGSPSVPVISVPVGTGAGPSPSHGPGPNQPPIFYNSTVPVPPAAGTGGAPPPAASASSTGQIQSFEGAGNKAFAVSGAGLVGVLALFAYVL